MNNEPIQLERYRVYETSFDRTVFVVSFSDIAGNTSGILLHDGNEYEYLEHNTIMDGDMFDTELITKRKDEIHC